MFCFRILRVLWIISVIWVVAGQTPATPQVELQLHHGVYFQPLGEVIVTGSDWTVCTTISLVTYEETHRSLLSQIEQVEEQLTDIESKVAGNSSKSPLFVHLQTMWAKLFSAFKQDLDSYLASLVMVKRTAIHNETRSSRGLINVVSNVGKYLFGFSTENDINALKSKISNLAAQGQNLTHLAGQQFSYIKTVATQTLHNGEQISKLRSSLSGMAKALDEFHQTTNAINIGIKFTGMGLEMLTAMELIREGLSQSQKGLSTLQKIIARAGEGTLAWELFEDPSFRTLLRDLGNRLPTGWKLLYDPEDHYSYLHYIAVEAHRAEEGLNLCMAIPIVKESGRYQLYEAISMPVVHPGFPEKLFFSYDFPAPYLAVQRAGSDYFTSPTGAPGNFFAMNNHREAKCVGEGPRVCSLLGAVRTPSPDRDSCLYDLFADNPAHETCPVQVQYQDGPVFRHVGLGVWLYGAARGTLQVRCSGQGTQPNSNTGHYKLTGTGAFRLQPGCEASLGQIKVPSYVNGRGQFKMDLPDAPIVNLFSMNFTRSLWNNITSDLVAPDNFTSFLKHLTDDSDIQKNSLTLKAFNESIQRYESLRNQLSPYHPFSWATNPEGQVSGFTLLLLLDFTSVVFLAVGLWKLRGRLNAMTQPQAATPEDRQLIRVRRRRRQTADQVV